MKWILDTENPLIFPAGYKKEEMLKMLMPLRRPSKGGDAKFSVTLEDMEGLIGRYENMRTVVTQFLPSILPLYKLKYRMEEQRDRYYERETGWKGQNAWLNGWKIGHDHEIRYRAEELLEEMEAGFTIRDWEDAPMIPGEYNTGPENTPLEDALLLQRCE